MELLGSLIESCRLDERTLTIDQLNIEELAFATNILPRAQVAFLYDSRFYYPVIAELVQGFDGHICVLRVVKR